MYQTCEYIKLSGMVNVNEFFSIEKMKNMNLLSFLFSVVLCTAIIVLAKEDQNETKVSSEKLQLSSVESSRNDLPKVLQVLQFSTTVTDQVTEKISESVIEKLPTTTDINNEATQEDSATTEEMEDINQNVTTEASILPKRHAVTSVPEVLSESEVTIEQSYLAPMTLDQLDSYSCIEEASTFGHNEAPGVLIHEVICELRKLWHYIVIAAQNLKTEFQIELPIETEEAIILLNDLLMDGAIIDTIEQGILQLEVFLENPENLNSLIDIIEKCVPMSHIQETATRLRIVVANFFVHLQGMVIYLEPHQSIHNYIELFSGFHEKICTAIENILGFFGIKLEAEVKLVSEFISTVRLILMKFSPEKAFEENLDILKEFVDILSKIYEKLQVSESSESIIEKVHTGISTYISTSIPENFNVPVVHFVLPDKSVATISYIWQLIDETSTDSVTISSNYDETPISKIDIISNVLEAEVKFVSDLFACVKLLFEELYSGHTFEQHLKILKECIDKFVEIYKEYNEMDCSISIIEKIESLISTFVSTLFTQDFELPVLHFNSPDGSAAVLKCAWQVTTETPIVKEDVKIDETKLLPGNIVQDTTSFKSSVSIQNADISTPIPTNKPSVLPLTVVIASENVPLSSPIDLPNVPSLSKESAYSIVEKDSSPKLPAAIIQPLASTTKLQTPNYGSSNTISSSASTVSAIRLPTNHSPIEDKPSQYKITGSPQEDNTKYSIESSSLTVNNNVPSSSPKVQVNTETVSLSTSLPLANKNSSPLGTKIRNVQQPPLSLSFPGKPVDSLTNSPQIRLSPVNPTDSLINSPPILPSSPEKSADFLDFVPSLFPFSPVNPLDLPSVSPPIPPSSPVNPIDLPSVNPPIPTSSPVKSVEFSITSPPIPSSSPVNPVDLPSVNPPIPPFSPVNPIDLPNVNPSILPSSLINPTDLSSVNPPIPPSPPVKSVEFSITSPPIPSSSVNPIDPLSINPPVTSFSLGNLGDLSGNNSPIPSPPEEPSDLSNSPQIFSSLAKPAELSTNGSPISSVPLEEPTDLSDNSPIFTAPLRPAVLSSNSPPIPPYPFGRPAELSSNSPSIPPYPFGGPVDFSENNPPIPPYPSEIPVDLSINNPPTFLPSPGRPTDLSFNNPPAPSYYPGKSPPDYSNYPPVYLTSHGESSPSVLFPGEHEPDVVKNYNKVFSPLTPPGYFIPASDIIPNLPRYQPLSNSYPDNLESAGAFFKSLYSYLQYGNPAVAPPPKVSNKISELLRRGFLHLYP
ncbi:uncharacterized threonine-rich GPI-anchored glycoprotein PJ4664.02-like [Osmia bicornis bicornis]|uniref:uncharacterized threonine-rich GPI-anchored glycoprotein PJ4664.02-like n=1 Tax=Osmia bicornis bicornis TaxID=1437191 RepID=UPI001EAEF0A7|nr:uncharacterized threonine-rich GPI-anchored glycoprotein PJ4664.02-like [Osmia bicornis bicornis]